MMIILKKDKFIFKLIVFKMLLDIVFRFLVADIYRYYGYSISDNAGIIVLSWIILIAYIPFMVKMKDNNSLCDKVVLFLFLMYFIPGLSVYQFVLVDLKMFIYWNTFWFVLAISSVRPKRLSGFRKNLVSSKGLGLFIICTVVLIIIYVFWRYAGLRLIITFTNEYILRENERKIKLPLVISYLYSMSQVILVIAICFSIRKRKTVISAFLILIQVFNFSIGGHKSVLILTLACIGIEIICERYDIITAQNIILSIMSAELALELILGKIFNNILLMANVSRRVYYLPQLINMYYYDYSTKHGFDYYSQILGKFFASSTNIEKIQYAISRMYMGSEGNANNGLFSEAYSNLGLFGCIILPIVIVVVTDILEVFLDVEDSTTILIFGFICAFIWGSGNITTGLLTNGLLLSAFLIYFLNSDEKRNKHILETA